MSVASPESGAPAPLSQHPSLLRFITARVAAMVANQMQIVATGWQVYELTGRAFDLGMVGLVQFLPSLLLTFVVGHVADRYDRRNVLRIALATKLLAVALMAWGTAAGWLTRESLFALAALIGAARAFEMPSNGALLASLVEPGLLPRAVATMASAVQGAVLVGPAIGGLVLAAGLDWAYGAAAALYGVAVLALMFVTLLRKPPAPAPATLASMFAGVGFIRRRPVVLGAISLDLFAVLLGGAVALLPIYARDILHIGAWGLGLLRSSEACGALAAAVFLARRPMDRHVGRKMFGAVAVFGLATIVFALSTWFWLSFVALAVLGAADMVSVVIRQSLVQLETPDDMRGRVGAVNSLFIGTSNQLGEFESGLTAAWFGTVPAVVLGGVGTLLIAGLWMRLFPELAKRDRLAEGGSR
ncbi:MFS transporter [Derxia lacustris]|uniref:MFS transporter n=1 Tax=Derxia lacustris TaxID=764842 RepID=UPI000A177CB6|nr:MFS transporter [Derxia lacustris]